MNHRRLRRSRRSHRRRRRHRRRRVVVVDVDVRRARGPVDDTTTPRRNHYDYGARIHSLRLRCAARVGEF